MQREKERGSPGSRVSARSAACLWRGGEGWQGSSDLRRRWRCEQGAEHRDEVGGEIEGVGVPRREDAVRLEVA
jgi:hypothetical protein